MFTRNRHGFTLVELLVVIAIIGMLVGILLPAVQGARNAGRRTQNSNNLKNLGLAIVSHAEAKGNLPPLRLIRPTGTKIPRAMKNYPDAEHSVSWAFELLPFVEQGNLYDQRREDLPTVHPQQVVTQQQLPLFQNPGRGERFNAYDVSGNQVISQPQTLIDYAANRGIANFAFNGTDEFTMGYQDKDGNDRSIFSGPFVHNELVTTAHVKDGLSKTIAIADKWVPRSVNGQYVDENGLAGTSMGSMRGHSIMRGPSAALVTADGRTTYDLREKPLFPTSSDKPAVSNAAVQSDLNRFGGSTGGSMLAVCYLDGHVEWIEYSVDEAAFISQCTMSGSDGLLQ